MQLIYGQIRNDLHCDVYGVYVEIIHFVSVNISKLVGYKAQVVFLSL